MARRAWLILALLTVPIIAVLSEPVAATVVTFTCDYTHSLPDDPIVFPGQPGASHLHDFFGNPSVDAYSTADSLAQVDDQCTAAGDHSGYWAPATYVNGQRAIPKKIGAYWRSGGLANLEPVPFGMQFVAGDAHATAPVPHVGWACTNGQETSTPHDCTSTHKGVTIRLAFANCWDGVDVFPADFAYSLPKTCPAGFKHPIPQLVMILQPRMPDGSRMYDPTGISFASGPFYTVHADFLAAFDPAAMQAIVDALNA